ncbi:Metallophosphoesterase MPPED2 [Dirofilaria immitis]|nr:Metallophosphoesterase MPPED2 [Dirofilaria immitis]
MKDNLEDHSDPSLEGLTKPRERRKSMPFIQSSIKNLRELGRRRHTQTEYSERNDNETSSILLLADDLEKVKFDDERTPSPSHIIQHRRSQRHLLRRQRRCSSFSIEVTPHKYTDDPMIAWEMLKNNRPVIAVRQMKLDTPIRQDAVRFVCMACLHQSFPHPQSIPLGDILIVAGNFTLFGGPDEVEDFSKYLKQLPHTFKIVIAGGNEYTFDDRFVKVSDIKHMPQVIISALIYPISDAAKLEDAIYLKDSSMKLFGIRIYGTPWLPQYNDEAFDLPRGQALLDKWNDIPTGVDVLITHTPPLGHGDMLSTGQHVGCVELLNSVVKRIRPKYHVFGHIHSGYGCTTDGYTKFVNCSLVDDRLQLTNNPIILI